ncbi:MAG: hypothetical protein ACOCSA_01980 [Candidatus Hadarchaeota archaeon]
MRLVTANTGSYPRIGHAANEMRLRKAYQKWERGELSDSELEGVYKDYTNEVIKEQEKAGLDVVTDGLLRWYDPFSHFAQSLDGCDINGLLRYFDTNFYFRQPVINGELERKEPFVLSEFKSAANLATKTLKPILTGPYTWGKHSINKYYGSLDSLIYDFAEKISYEVEDLEKAGADEIQINEPAILRNPDEFEVFFKAIEIVAKGNQTSQLDLYLYFEDPAPIYERLQDLPVDLLGLDFTYSQNLINEIIETGSEKRLGLGLIDARNTKMEDAENVADSVIKIANATDHEQLYLNPSCGLEFLPRERAREKLEKIVEVAKKSEADINER